jgi:fibronectin type 3 domain-containing protein
LAGSPAATATAGVAYSFQPTLEQGGGTITYSIAGRPSWASFNTSTGALSGTPSTTNEGKSAPITISASNGSSSASLAPFTIQVNAPSATTGSASLTWTAPTTNADGSEVTDLAGYHVYYGTSESSLQQTITITTPTVTNVVVNGLSAGTYYFTVVAYNSLGVDSADSNIVSKTI